MSLIGQMNLVRLGKVLAETTVQHSQMVPINTKTTTRFCAIGGSLVGTEIQFRSTFGNSRAYIQARFYASSGGESEQETSKSHQHYHRKSYEYKRSNYQKTQGKGHKESSAFNDRLTHYQKLNVATDADADTIKAAYYSLSKEYHPDVVGSEMPDAVDKFRQITESYEVLGNENSRADYDRSIGVLSNEWNVLSSSIKSSHPNKNYSPFSRQHQANVVFKNREDTILAQEKLKNPNKFRAGVFRHEQTEERDTRSVNERLDRQLKMMNQLKSISPQARYDGSDFYRRHLEDTVRRRMEGLKFESTYRMPGDQSRVESGVELAVVVAICMAVFVVSVVNLFFKADIPARLDQIFEFSVVEGEKTCEDDAALNSVEVAR